MTQAPPPPPAQTQTSGKAIASLVCSIVGFFTCPLVLHIIGLVLGNAALKEIRAAPDRLDGEGLAKTGVILAWIGIGLAVLGLCLWLAMVGIMAAGGGA